MSGPTDKTKFIRSYSIGSEIGVQDLLEHLTAMGRDSIGIGEGNAAAARTARALIQELAAQLNDARTSGVDDETGIDLYEAEVTVQ